jgi:hypothetical protein
MTEQTIAESASPRPRFFFVRSERGEVASWLIVAAALAAAAVLAGGVLGDTISSLSSNVETAALGGGGTTGDGGTIGDGGGDTDGGTTGVGGGTTNEPILGPPLPDVDETENWFFPGEHSYSHVSPAAGTDTDALMRAMNERGVHPNQTEPFIPGQPYVGDVDIPGPFGEDHVSTTAIYDANGNQIGVRNVTLENHALHPGWVERRMVRDSDGNLRIQTLGGGSGALGGPNVWFDESVWSDVDNEAISGL